MSGFFIALCVILCLASAVASIYGARDARAALESLEREVASLTSSMESLRDSQTSTLETLEALANKVKMQRVRNVVAHSAGSAREPDAYSDPESWRKAMNRKLGMAHVAPKANP